MGINESERRLSEADAARRDAIRYHLGEARKAATLWERRVTKLRMGETKIEARLPGARGLRRRVLQVGLEMEKFMRSTAEGLFRTNWELVDHYDSLLNNLKD